jgi:UPF0755 protein
MSIFVLFAFMALYFGYFLVSPAGIDSKEETFIVKRGKGLKAISGELWEKRLIKNKSLFMLWAMLTGGTRNIKAGEYGLSQSMAPVKILNILTSGMVKTHYLTIPEGLTVEQIADLLEKSNLVNIHKKEFLDLVNDKALVTSYNIDGSSLEGYLFPDTYLINRDISAKELIDLMVKHFWGVFNALADNPEYSTKGLVSLKEIVTLASIVEKETGLAEERPLIASVFINRLKKRMRLESDPTVIYGLKDFDGNLKRKDLRSPNPYNTYMNYGLPPGPIANPGKGSLVAVINPEKTDYLYFVSKNDGSHHFSSTLTEHNKAVAKYQGRYRPRSNKRK